MSKAEFLEDVFVGPGRDGIAGVFYLDEDRQLIVGFPIGADTISGICFIESNISALTELALPLMDIGDLQTLRERIEERMYKLTHQWRDIDAEIEKGLESSLFQGAAEGEETTK